MKIDAINFVGGVFVGLAFTRFLSLMLDPNNMIEAVIFCSLAVIGVLFLIWYNK